MSRFFQAHGKLAKNTNGLRSTGRVLTVFGLTFAPGRSPISVSGLRAQAPDFAHVALAFAPMADGVAAYLGDLSNFGLPHSGEAALFCFCHKSLIIIVIIIS